VHFREAIDIDPGHAEAHNNLGTILFAQKQTGEAIGHFREAVAIDPEYAQARHNLGLALVTRGEFEEAAGHLREAVRIDPGHAMAHLNLGAALRGLGRFEESLEAYRRGHEIGSRREDWRVPSGQAVRNAELMVRQDRRLSEILAGDAPADAGEALSMAELCQKYKRRPIDAARFYAAAFEGNLLLAADPRTGRRYNAACAAAVAAGDLSRLDPLGAGPSAHFRSRALGWLSDDLDAWEALVEGQGEQARSQAAQMLGRGKQDPDLAAVRDAGALAGLPEAERGRWLGLWAGVDTLLGQVDPRAPD
jgi:tetratricopeptide (TPR) repeat protein